MPKVDALTPYRKFHAAVLRGKATVCEFVRLAVERQERDLARTDWEYRFDEKEAARAVLFVRLLKHTKGAYAGINFNLTDWQTWHLAVLFGWRNLRTGSRRYTRSYLEVARKNGKTELAAAILLFGLVADGEYGAECYSVATTRDQAGLSFKAAKEMARRLRTDSPGAAKMLTVYKHSIATNTNAFIQALSSDSHTLDGLNPHMGLVDEYHEHKTNALPSVLETGMGSRRQPLLYIITTAGYHKEYPCYSEERYNAVQVLRGHREENSLFSLIFTLDETDDWQDERVWVKANPNIGLTPTWENMRRGAQVARNRGERARVEFLTKNLNVWTETSSTWIKPEDWAACALAETQQGTRGVFLGIDLANTSDVTAVCEIGQTGDGLHFRFHYFLPEDTARDRQQNDGVPYLDWAKAGHITLTPGNVCDYQAVREYINRINENRGVAHAAIDPYNAWQIASDLAADGIPIEPYRQGFLSMSEPTKQFERLVKSAGLRHENDPVTAWMLGNVELERDAAGNIKPSKKKSSEKIDGISAAVTALGGYLVKTGKPAGGTYLDENELFGL